VTPADVLAGVVADFDANPLDGTVMIAPGGVAVFVECLRSLLAELAQATATVWTDPDTGDVYDLSRPLRDADGEYWHHIGWLAPVEGPVPLVMWSPSPTREHLGTRWSDVAVLPRVIEEHGPLATAGAGGGAS
jgi:hypothetical protein